MKPGALLLCAVLVLIAAAAPARAGEPIATVTVENASAADRPAATPHRPAAADRHAAAPDGHACAADRHAVAHRD